MQKLIRAQVVVERESTLLLGANDGARKWCPRCQREVLAVGFAALDGNAAELLAGLHGFEDRWGTRWLCLAPLLSGADDIAPNTARPELELPASEEVKKQEEGDL